MPALNDAARESVFIGTLHSFCISEILAPHGGRLEALAHGYSVVTPEHPVAEKAIENILGREPTGADIDDFSEVRRSSDGAAIATRNLTAAQIEKYWADLLDEGTIDFAGVLYYAALLLETLPDVARAVASSFARMIVDEYQDTSVSQVRILRAIARAGSSKWLLIGDFNQSIFGFNGVSRTELEQFAVEIGAKPATLRGTYRCPVSVVQQATNLIPLPEMRSAVKGRTGTVYEFEGSVAASVRGFMDLLAEHEIVEHRAAIIAPARWLLQEAQRRLMQRRIPVPSAPRYRFSGRSAVSDTICAILGYAYHDDTRHLTSSVASVKSLLDTLPWAFKDDEAEYVIFGVIDDVRRTGKESIRLTDTAQIVQLRLIDLVPSSIQDRLKGLFEVALRPSVLRNSPLLEWSGDELARLECSHKSLVLSTIHSAKGLEFDAVLFLGFQEGVLPHPNSSELDEDERKAYVTITRSANLLMYASEPGLRSRFWDKAMGSATRRSG